MVKVERSFPAPKSLEKERIKKAGSYTKPDVIEQLKSDFHNKCYICELKDLQDPQVEHLLPHKDGKFPDRKFDWNNLFWVCGHCNNVKAAPKYDEGIIDCCREDPEEMLTFRLLNSCVEVRPLKSSDSKLDRTAMLVQEVFNLRNTGMRIYKSDIRFQELNKEMNILYDTLEEFKITPTSKVVARKLKALLRRESKFAAFKRNYIREHNKLFPGLLKYLD